MEGNTCNLHCPNSVNLITLVRKSIKMVQNIQIRKESQTEFIAAMRFRVNIVHKIQQDHETQIQPGKCTTTNYETHLATKGI